MNTKELFYALFTGAIPLSGTRAQEILESCPPDLLIAHMDMGNNEYDKRVARFLSERSLTLGLNELCKFVGEFDRYVARLEYSQRISLTSYINKVRNEIVSAMGEAPTDCSNEEFVELLCDIIRYIPDLRPAALDLLCIYKERIDTYESICELYEALCVAKLEAPKVLNARVLELIGMVDSPLTLCDVEDIVTLAPHLISNRVVSERIAQQRTDVLITKIDEVSNPTILRMMVCEIVSRKDELRAMAEKFLGAQGA